MALDVAPAFAQVEEVIVTARRREESIQNIPVAVTALSEEQLERFAITGLEEVAATTPQLKIIRGTSGNGANISLRGIGSNFTSLSIEQSVAINLDGVYYGQGRVLNEALFDMQRLEMLKGPQALFFGKNATAGVISMTSNDPGDSFEASGQVGYEFTAEQPSVEAIVSGPLTKDIGLRLAVRWAKMEGGFNENIAPSTTYRTRDVANGFAATFHPVTNTRNKTPQLEELAARLTAKYQPTDDFSWTVKAAVSSYFANSATWNAEMYFCPLGAPQADIPQECKGDRRIHENNLPVAIAATNSLMNKEGGHLYDDYKSHSFTNNLSYAPNNVVLSWITGYHKYTKDSLGQYSPRDSTTAVTWGIERSSYSALSTELRAQTMFDGPLDFMGGIYYDDTELTFFQDVIFPGGLENSAAADPSTRYITVRKAGNSKGTTFAAYAQAMWDILPDLQFTAGLRYTQEAKFSDFYQPYVIPAFQAVFVQYNPANPATRPSAHQTFENLSPEAALTWNVTPRLMIYGAYKTGYKSGGFSISGLNGVSTRIADLAFDPEKVEGLEAGVRAVLFDNTLRVGFDVFDYEYTDLQVDFFDARNVKYVTYNAGSAVTRGAELNFEWAPDEVVDGLSVRGSLGYNDAHYTSFPAAPCWGGQSQAQGCNVFRFFDSARQEYTQRPCNTPGETCQAQNLAGRPTALAPEWVAALQANYEARLTENLQLALAASVNYSGSYMTSIVANPYSVQDAYATFDASVGLSNEAGSWELSLIGKNLTDEYVVVGSADAAGTGANTGLPGGVPSDLVGYINAPRTVELQLKVSF